MQTQKRLLEEFKKRILVIDGAMGTALQDRNLTAEDFGGEDLEGCNEVLVLKQAQVIREIHEMYLAAGADIVETNTFGGTPLVLNEYGIGHLAYEINFEAAKLARAACEKYHSEDKPRFVAGSIGPTTKAISVTGGITFDELQENFYQQAKALYEGGVDYFLIETCQDTRNIKAALLGIDQVFDEKKQTIPVAVSITIEPTGTMLAGQGVEALSASLAHRDLLYIGLNCATGPSFMTDHIRSLAQLTESRVACVPNAGLPDEEGRYLESPEMISQVLSGFAQQGWLNLVGGCCGTTAEHIKALNEMVQGFAPRKAERNTRHFLSGIEYLEITDEMSPLIVGERTNVIGSRKFKRLISNEEYEEASEVGRAQVKKGAQIVDVCLSNPDRDELHDMKAFLEEMIKKIKCPLMIDSMDEQVIEEALKYSQGKAIINSINLEDGEDRYEKVVPLAKKYGAALVVGTIDEDPIQGMGVSRERKIEIAARSYELLTQKYGIKAEDIYFDLLVFPVGTGDEQYKGSAVETIEAIRLLKEKYPHVKTVLGVSNVSFGLPPAGREVLNSVYVYHCVKAGLDLAIVNSEMMERFASIPAEEIKLAEDLLWNRGEDPIAAFADFYRDKVKVEKVQKSNLSLEERLAHYILEGTKEGLEADLAEALKKYAPLEIINGPLMKGMDQVGQLFARNELIVAEVLQSAESMKAAVRYLEPHMEQGEKSTKGVMLLATVKGDVHDIGKNLVDIILSNNGYEVINLGIKISPEQLIEATKKYKPDMIGLSGLLVKSAQQMVITAHDLSEAKIDVPVLVGGAALSENFVIKKIAPNYQGTVTYAQDAMNGLELADQIMDPQKFSLLKKALLDKAAEILKKSEADEASPKEKKQVVLPKPLSDLPQAPDFSRHLLKNIAPDEVFRLINPAMLYGRHLGIKGKAVKCLAAKDLKALRSMDGGEKAIEIFEIVEELKKTYRHQLIAPKAVYQFFQVQSNGSELIFYEKEQEILRWAFPRSEQSLSLVDYISKDKMDSLAVFVVTACGGDAIRLEVEKLKNAGEFLKSHALAALALETAEACAEYLHAKLRGFWGFPDGPEMTLMKIFRAEYQGKRYSPGYPACPDLEDQQKIFDLLKPSEIGVQLTEGFMMEPEASVSAIVFHHPDATYFSI